MLMIMMIVYVHTIFLPNSNRTNSDLEPMVDGNKMEQCIVSVCICDCGSQSIMWVKIHQHWVYVTDRSYTIDQNSSKMDPIHQTCQLDSVGY